MQSLVIECDPPRRLVFTWDGDSDVTIDLEPRGNEVLLTVVHRHLGSRNRVLMHSAGWHAHLDLPVDRTSGQRPEPFWDRWIALQADYDTRPPRCRRPPRTPATSPRSEARRAGQRRVRTM